MLRREIVYIQSPKYVQFSCDDFHVAYNTYQTLDFKMIEIQIHILDDHIKTDGVLHLI